ncbi:MAG: VCBS repeat-containing protein [Chloroflexota bacterium]
MPNSATEHSALQQYLWDVFLLILLLLLLLPKSIDAKSSDAKPPDAKSSEPIISVVDTQAESQSFIGLETIAQWYGGDIDYETMSIAWGDMDDDGDLDLAVGNRNGPNLVYVNKHDTHLTHPELTTTDNIFSATPIWTSTQTDQTYAVAWGDVDKDGDLDLAVGNRNGRSRVYENEDGLLLTNPIWSSSQSRDTRSIAWADVNNDGFLDLTLGNRDTPVEIYHNQNGTLANTVYWAANEGESTLSIAWADVNGDALPDLAVGNEIHPLRLYLNTGTTLSNTPTWSATSVDSITSLAWADVNGDGLIDLATGNRNASNHVYLNQGSLLEPTPSWSSTEADETWSVAWADVDNDGDLDLMSGNSNGVLKLYVAEQIEGITQLGDTAVWTSGVTDNTRSVAFADVDGDGDIDMATGNLRRPNKLYRNQLVALGNAAEWSSADSLSSYDAAWGDVDDDGDIDLAVANWNDRNQLFLNVAGALQTTASWFSDASNQTVALAWGDMDGDTDLDLAVVNRDAADAVYLNQNGILETSPSWQADVQTGVNDNGSDIAWADIDNDRDLDLAIAIFGGPTLLYMNQGTSLETSPAWLSDEIENSTSLAWGDADNDGDLDLAVGNYRAANQLYLNDAGILQEAAMWSSVDKDETESVAWGDINRDGLLDLVVGNRHADNKVYFNIGGTLATQAGWRSNDADETLSVTLADVDSDGDLDLAAGNREGVAKVYLNQHGELTETALWHSAEQGAFHDVALADVNIDGYLDLAVTNADGVNYLYPYHLPTSPLLSQLANTADSLMQIDQTLLAPANHYALSTVNDDGLIAVPYQLSSSIAPNATLRGFFSNDGGVWNSATPADDVSGVSTNQEQFYSWDIYGSGFFGQNANTSLRLEAYPSPGLVINNLPAIPQRPLWKAQTRPFRTQGNAIQVLRYDKTPSAGAIVYRIPADATAGDVIAASDGIPAHTDSQGILQSSAAFDVGDQDSDRFVALSPIESTASYTVYHTSATPTTLGLDLSPAANNGLHTLTSSDENPLILFNLTVSLEWDARNDDNFMVQLNTDLRRTSELLYDWTNGQAALGDMTIYHDKTYWDAADLQIFASNRLRPNADIGGIVENVENETILLNEGAANEESMLVHYVPGAVRMGVVWNRFDDSVSTVSDDWPRALAHELGHYLFFLQDNYLGLDEENTLISVDTCPSAMSNPYRDAQTEFHPEIDWLPNCAQTMNQRLLGRWDWETITVHYPMLNAPTQSLANLNQGPTNLQLNVTQIRVVEPATEVNTFDAPLFSLIDANGGRYQPGKQARAFLFKADPERLIDVGRPTQDFVRAWGSEPGDRLCVFETESLRTGCETLADESDSVTLSVDETWQPRVRFSIVTSSTIQVQVDGLASNLTLQAQLFPRKVETSDAESTGTPTTIQLAYQNNRYQGTFNLTEPATAAQVALWVGTSGEAAGSGDRLLVLDYGLGGAPLELDDYGLLARNNRPAQLIDNHVDNAPAISSDGQVMLFVPQDEFLPGEFHTLQSTPFLPASPNWLTVIGKGYYLSASANAPDLDGASLRFRYLVDEVPAGEEAFLRVYRYDDTSNTWNRLPTALTTDSALAEAIARVPGPGLYALMSTLEVPIETAGWNLISYPVQDVRPIADALASIEGQYTTLFAYDTQDPNDPWKGYSADPATPDWVNEFAELEFARGYWIYVTEPVTISMSSTPQMVMMQAATHAPLSPSTTPPSTFYGEVVGADGFTPTANQRVTIWAGDMLCGSGLTKLMDDAVVYAVDAHAIGPCSNSGQELTFHVDGHEMNGRGMWQNDVFQPLMLEPGGAISMMQIYLPMVR